MWVLWNSKGGAGCSVIAAALGLLSCEQRSTLLVDLGGDLPAILGCEAARPVADDGGLRAGRDHRGHLGVSDWLGAEDPPPDALGRLEVPVTPQLSILPLGTRPRQRAADERGPTESMGVLTRLLSADNRRVIVDLGLPTERFEMFLERAAASILVVRPCYLALRRPLPARVPDHVVLIREPGRALRPSDVGAAIGRDVSTVVGIDPGVARAVDAGLLGSRLPRRLLQLRSLLTDLSASGSPQRRSALGLAAPGRA